MKEMKWLFGMVQTPVSSGNFTTPDQPARTEQDRAFHGGVSREVGRAGFSSRIDILPVSLGIVFMWFGALKFFPNLSPAETLAIDTICRMTFGMVHPDVSIILLALLETGIGISLVFNFRRRVVAVLAFMHILCTFTPLVFFPEQVFVNFPFQLTLLGQYIAKNIIILGVLATIIGRRGAR